MENYEIISLQREIDRLSRILYILDRVEKLFSTHAEKDIDSLCREIGKLLRSLGITIITLKRVPKYYDIVYMLEQLKHILINIVSRIKRGEKSILYDPNIRKEIKNILEIRKILSSYITILQDKLITYIE